MTHRISDLVAFVGSALVIILMAYLGLSRSLGAHPFWAVNVALYATVPAAICVGLSRNRPRLGLGLSLVVLCGAGALAVYGKSVFVASYAENALAGRFWFFGWVSICIGATWFLTLAVMRLIRR